ncbi:hypothetical protein RFI_18249, partial [Reticulomyxa filosa]
IKYDFQIQMPRENTQEIIVLKQSKERSSVLLRLLLQTARERDVLCTILNALINKKKEMRQARLQLKDVVRLEIYPTNKKKLELAQEQMNQLKMVFGLFFYQNRKTLKLIFFENTQLTEEKRIWKNEKDKLYE